LQTLGLGLGLDTNGLINITVENTLVEILNSQ